MKNNDFVSSLKKLLLSMKEHWKLIIVATLFATTASILTLRAPNKLSDLTDLLSEGLIPDKEILLEIQDKVSNNLNNIEDITNKLVLIDFTKISELNNLNENDKQILLNLNKENFNKLTNDTKLKLLKDNEYNISKTDVLIYLDCLNNKDFASLPESISNLLFKPFIINDFTVNSIDQKEMIVLFNNLENATKEELISKMDELPTNIYELVKPKIDLESVKNITLKVAIIYILTSIFYFIEGIIICSEAIKYSKKLRTKIINKLSKLPLSYFDKITVGDLLSRVTNDVNTINSTMNDSLSSLISALTLFLGCMFMMFKTNWIMALTAIFSSLLGFVFLSIILSKSQKYFIKKQSELGKLNGHIEETFTNHQVVKLDNGFKISNDKFDELNNNLYVSERKSQFLSGLMPPLMGFIGNFGYVCVCIVGAILTKNGTISFGVIVAFMMYIRLFTNPLSEIAQALSSLQSGVASSKRVFEFLNQEEMILESNKQKLLCSNAKGKIDFEHVKFGYNKNKMIIKDFNANIKPGEKVAIVGPTGAGKTTLINLIMKFYELNSGDIKIDDIPISDLTRENVHDLFIMVLQDTWLFNGTIRDNMKFNNKATDEEIWKVAKVVGVDHFIKTLPNGLDSVINDSNNISAGEKQLITIARGMIKNAPFLILDEATSNVDTRTEELVQIAMDKLMKNRTSFIIAHRLSTIKNANLILYLENGNVLEQGTHEELMKLNGKYAKLYNSQFEKIK